jgi:lipopolysaccharide biosynthesis protein
MTSCIAFYLPQYHPIPENDYWWGKGFTEWRNVTQAKPLYPGHYQPHLATDLGYYDLRVPEVREQQANLARQYGISGFCYYHYWFSGKQLLERPTLDVLRSGEPDFPFCLCWANENWTRRWDGRDDEVLIEAQYSDTDDVEHFSSLLPFFRDSRYICIDQKPLFLVYRASELPNPLQTTQTWRELAIQNGLPGLYLVKVESSPSERSREPMLDGFDSALDFQPDWSVLKNSKKPSFFSRIFNKLGLSKHDVFANNRIFSYSDVVNTMLSRNPVAYPRYPCVTPSWDNSARRRNGGATILHDSTPSIYAYWLRTVLLDHDLFAKVPERIVFINAWNEWAEGSHLEPDAKWGHQYLEKTRDVLLKNRIEQADVSTQ